MTTIGEQLTADVQTVIDTSMTEAKSLITPVFNVAGYSSADAAYADLKAAGGGVLYFPAGTYEVNLVIDAPCVIQGAGQQATYLLPADTSKPVLQIGDGSTDVRHVAVKDLTVGAVSGSITTPAGVKVYGCYWADLERVEVDTCTGDNILIASSATRPVSYVQLSKVLSHWANGSCLHLNDTEGQYVTAVFCDQCTIQAGAVDGASAIRINNAGGLSLATTWVQARHQKGIIFDKVGVLRAASVIVDSESSSDELVTFNVEVSRAISLISGSISVDGLLRYVNGETATLDGKALHIVAPRIYDGFVQGNLWFENTAAATSALKDTNDQKVKINRNGNSLWLIPDTANGGQVRSSGPVMVQSAGVIYSGTGSPEGVVTASVGSIYLRTNGGAGTCLYVKESGTGNTGWVAK